MPAALVVLGDLYVLDEEGEPFKRVHAGGRAGPAAGDRAGPRGVHGGRGRGAARASAQALDVARAYGAAVPGARASGCREVRLRATTALTLVTATGQEVRLGEGRRASRSCSGSRACARELARARARAEVIHLDNRARPGWVAVKLSGPGSERTGASTQ